jgi:hypothetical protein
LAIDEACFGASFTPYSNGLALEIDVAVAVTGIGAGSDKHGIPVVGVVDRGLDGVEAGWAIVIDGDRSAGGCNCHRQQHDRA